MLKKLLLSKQIKDKRAALAELEAKKEEFDKKNQKLGKAKMGQMFVFGIFRPMVYMLYISSILCLFYFGAKGYLNNTVFLGQVIGGIDKVYPFPYRIKEAFRVFVCLFAQNVIGKLL